MKKFNFVVTNNIDMYPAEVVAPFREDLTAKGFKELTSSEELTNILTFQKEPNW